ncbi:unnamed protein product [Mytilus coruscus]|uniref:Uncharacterized protein n=1 Tax=Mytilus coruscus TaxID=42192 RepID=A0A6J8AZJ4_MYTCO|nr:unnamed protein product [Mytilus coruscus]
MAEFKCSLCIFETSKFEDVIFHAIHTHANREICIFKRNGDRKAYKRLTFPVVPEVEHKKGKVVLTNNEKQTINVVDLDEHLVLPANKSKTDSKNKDENQEPQKTIETCSQTEDINEDVVSIDTKNLGKINKQFLIDLLPFIPMALQYLHENNQLAVWFILLKLEQNSKPSSCIQGIVKCLGLRQKDLKTLRKKRQYALDKIKQEAGDRMRDSKYAFILSSLQTSLYEVRRTITAIQSTTKSLLQIGAYFSGFAYPTLSSVDISEQPNYKCLIGMDKEMLIKYNIPTKVYCQFVKQRSEE